MWKRNPLRFPCKCSTQIDIIPAQFFFIPFFGYGFCKLTPQGNWKRIENSATRSMRHTQSKHKFFSSFSAIHTYIFYILWVYREGVTGGGGGSGHKIEISCNWSLSFCFFGFWVLLRLLCPIPVYCSVASCSVAAFVSGLVCQRANYLGCIEISHTNLQFFWA